MHLKGMGHPNHFSHHLCSRHPEPDSRPTFTMILLTLFEYEKHIRTVQTDDDIIHKQNQAPSSSENEYLELQQWYAN